MAFKLVLMHASRVFDIAGFGKISKSVRLPIGDRDDLSKPPATIAGIDRFY